MISGLEAQRPSQDCSSSTSTYILDSFARTMQSVLLPKGAVDHLDRLACQLFWSRT